LDFYILIINSMVNVMTHAFTCTSSIILLTHPAFVSIFKYAVGTDKYTITDSQNKSYSSKEQNLDQKDIQDNLTITIDNNMKINLNRLNNILKSENLTKSIYNIATVSDSTNLNSGACGPVSDEFANKVPKDPKYVKHVVNKSGKKLELKLNSNGNPVACSE